MRGCGLTSIGLMSLWPDHVVCYIPAHRILPRQPSLAQPFTRLHARDPLQLIRRGVSYFLSRKVAIVKETPTSSRVLDYAALQQENDSLRYTLRQMEIENKRSQETSSKIIIETFEREPPNNENSWYDSSFLLQENGITVSGDSGDDVLWCDNLDGDTCPVEPTISFFDAAKDRAYWLAGLLILQSFSGFILSHNEALLERHPVIIYFLTMLVGAGGNAGNQASVRGT
jgi:hypothetical protein